MVHSQQTVNEPKRDWVAISAIIIALCALIVSVWEGCETRENYRLSVLPNLQLQIQSRLGGPISIELKNTGIGPAIIGSYRVLFADSLVYDNAKMQDWDSDKLKELLRQKGIEGGTYHYFGLTPSTFISAGENVTIFSFTSSDSSAFYGRSSIFVKTINLFKVRVEYSSVYGDQFKTVNYR